MKANFFQKYLIMLRSLWATFFVSLQILYFAIFKKVYQEKVNQVFYNYAIKILKIAKVSYRIVNPEHVRLEKGKPYIIMSNHLSHYDIPLIVVAFPDGLRMMVKKELTNIPVWGTAMKKSDFISVDRGNPKDALKALKAAKKTIESGMPLWIAPEGTRSISGKLGLFKKGGFVLAKQTHALIIPVAIVGSEKILAPKTWDFYLNQEVEIRIGKPIDASKYAPKEREKLMNDVRENILQMTSATIKN